MLSDVTFRFVWKQPDPGLRRDVSIFWAELGALPPETIEERLDELCAVAYVDGQVAASATVRKLYIAHMRSQFFYYRTTVSPNLRRQRVAWRLLAFSRDRLTEWSQGQPAEKVRGITFTLEADDLFRTRRSLPVIADEGLDLLFVGFTNSGQQIRVLWFEDATIE